jgi:23S rRNA (cytosine1962-C5)-methyltransferase
MTHDSMLILAPGREYCVEGRHQWIFSGAVQKIPEHAKDGECVRVASSRGDFLGIAFLNRQSSIVGRMISFDDRSADAILSSSLKSAFLLRQKLFGDLSGKMYRLVNAEADMLSGLVVDVYDTTAVIQVSSLGMERYKTQIVEELCSLLPLKWVYEKSTSPSRKHEGLAQAQGTVFGEAQPMVQVEEAGLRFKIDVKEGQKTGFFIDQREMRGLVRQLSAQKRVLNCFSYSGAFSLAAISGGALSCTSIDSSQGALRLLEEHLQLNGMQSAQHNSVCGDVFAWLESNKLDYDLVILDPPAFAKRKQDVDNALKGYKEINRRVLQKLPSGSFLMTFSCSYHVSPDQFLAMLKKASLDAKRPVRVLSHHRHAWDHPMSIYHSETDYLKSALLYVE